LNYIGQLRIYSLLDMVVFAFALTRDTKSIVGMIMLWIGFLLLLEGMHKDKMRRPVSRFLWIAFFVPALFLLPLGAAVLFMLFGFFYAAKKRSRFFGLTSPLWRGLQNFSLAFLFNPRIAVLAFVLMAGRNLLGDFRDAGSDMKDGARTIPVRLGLKQNQRWAFYGHMIAVVATTAIWFYFSQLSFNLFWPVAFLEIISYPLTPRASNPDCLNFYTVS